STASVHHPAHMASMAALRPGERAVDLDGFFLKSFSPGFHAFLRDELRFTDDEMAQEYRIWRSHAEAARPAFFPGFLDALAAYRAAGGRFVVVSHSEGDLIRRHYREANRELMPDAVFGWEAGEGRRKPDPWPALETLRRFGLAPGEALVVDDLSPGILMARAAGIPSAAAGWAHHLPEVRDYMRTNTLGILETVADFAAFILQA
ncbi:MAG TPA: HAD family phosphatase, partial [Holophaga sp.]|nr:HAD family phosphatase [Holophaga sp.]